MRGALTVRFLYSHAPRISAHDPSQSGERGRTGGTCCGIPTDAGWNVGFDGIGEGSDLNAVRRLLVGPKLQRYQHIKEHPPPCAIL
jgi:hypothetical protein